MLFKKVVLLGVFLLILMNFASAQYYSYDYYDSFSSFGGSDNILYIYESNSSLIDFFLFLLIFLGITQAIFSQGHFASQSKILSIGISLALSIGIVFWERNTGFNLLTFGPFAFLIILILIYYVILNMLMKMGTQWWVAGAFAYVIVFSILVILSPNVTGVVSFQKLFPWMTFFFWVAVIGGLVGLFLKPPTTEETRRAR